ncbi:hypothetical protein ACFL03_02365 [Thermodesulfobacteriota bacterium]
MKRKFDSPVVKAGVHLLVFSFVFLTVSPSVLYAEMDGIPSKVEKAALQAGSEAAAVAANAAEATPESVGQAASKAAAQVALDAGLTGEQAEELSGLAAIRSSGGTAAWMPPAGWIIISIAVLAGVTIYVVQNEDTGQTATHHVSP